MRTYQRYRVRSDLPIILFVNLVPSVKRSSYNSKTNTNHAANFKLALHIHSFTFVSIEGIIAPNLNSQSDNQSIFSYKCLRLLISDRHEFFPIVFHMRMIPEIECLRSYINMHQSYYYKRLSSLFQP